MYPSTATRVCRTTSRSGTSRWPRFRRWRAWWPPAKSTPQTNRQNAGTCREDRSLPDLIVKSNNEPDANGTVVKVTPESAGWEYVGFEVLRLAAGESVERRAEGEEVCLVPASGTCSV